MKLESKHNNFHIYKQMDLKLSSATWWPFCPNLRVLKSVMLMCQYHRSRIPKYMYLPRPGRCWQGSPLQWRHNGHDGISNHQPHDCLLKHLFRRKSKITSKLRVTGLCVGNSPVTEEFPTQMASNTENVSIWWRHHDYIPFCTPVKC